MRQELQSTPTLRDELVRTTAVVLGRIRQVTESAGSDLLYLDEHAGLEGLAQTLAVLLRAVETVNAWRDTPSAYDPVLPST